MSGDIEHTRLRPGPPRRGTGATTALAVASAAMLVVALALAMIVPGAAAAASATLHRAPHPAPVPVTAAAAHTEGILPPAVPPANIAPSPNFLADCSGTAYDDTPTCVADVLQAIGNARQQEGLPGMVLPTDWSQLSPQEQLFTATNLERTVRGLPPLAGMASALDSSSAQAAAANEDPSPPSGFPWTSWGGNWAAAVGNPLEAVYFWMYDDGLGSTNLDCTPSDTSGCWGHRANILMAMSCQPCVMGVGLDPTSWQGDPSWTELLVNTSGSPALDFAWSAVQADLPGQAQASGSVGKAVGIASAPNGQGYWLASAQGGVFNFGSAAFYGSMAGGHLTSPIAGIASTPDGQGYWLVAADGGIFAFGDAGFYGSMGGHRLTSPVVGIASTPGGRGYWLVAADGGIFAFGDAGFYGSMGGHRLTRAVVGMTAMPDGRGYWEVASDGGLFAFGNAPFLGSMGGTPLFRPVVAMTATPDGNGYWMVASDGGIFAFGNAPFRGSTGGHALAAPVVSMCAPPVASAGYWLAASDGGIFSFGVPFHGSMG